MADERGRVLIICCSSFMSSLDAIKQIHGGDQFIDAVRVSDDLEAITWSIENKYFTAEIELCYSNKPITPSTLKSSDVCFESIIIVFDQARVTSLKDASTWMECVELQNASVLLLLNTGQKDNTTTSEGIPTKDVLEWCLKYSFELVELKPDNEEQEVAGEFGEQTGFGRVIQALQCGEWPNIILKEKPGHNKIEKCKSDDKSTDDEKSSNKTQELSTPQLPSTQEPDAAEKITKKGLDYAACLPDEESQLLSRIGSEDPGDESFEDLFQRLKDMKDRAASLPDSERKSYAEKVAIAFWKAMGGDEDEISGLNDGCSN